MEPAHRHIGRWIALAAALLVIAGGAVAFALARKHHRATPAARYETVKVDRGRIVARVTATGTLSALVTVQVGSQVSGRIQHLYADFNSSVKRGQVIAKIDPQLYTAALEQARANVAAIEGQLAAARANAENAELLRRRTEQLHAQKLVAPQELDTANATARAMRAQVDAISGQLKQSKAARHQAEINLAYTDIVSPTDGTVISRNVDVGQTVAAAFQAPVLFTIAENLRKMQVDTSVAEADVGKLEPGMRATFAVDAFAGTQFAGVVRQIRNAPQTVQNVVTYDAVLDVDNAGLKLRPGMTANVTFVYGEKGDVVRVPNSALRFRAPDAWTAGKKLEGGERRTVWKLENGSPVPVSVRVGMSDGVVSELTDGALREGDVLITDAGGASSVPPMMRRVL